MGKSRFMVVHMEKDIQVMIVKNRGREHGGERERERGRQRGRGGENIDLLFLLFMQPLVTFCMCHDYGSNLQPLHIGTTL